MNKIYVRSCSECNLELKSISPNKRKHEKCKKGFAEKERKRKAKNRYPREFEYIKKFINNRDKFCCRCCNKNLSDNPKSMHTHHIDENKKNNKPENLVTVCRSCHRKLHSRVIEYDFKQIVFEIIDKTPPKSRHTPKNFFKNTKKSI